ncbi:hypothetical protein OHO28_51560 [Streptomyces europaeiscabiei]
MAGELPLIEGTLIRFKVDHLPGDRDVPPVWLWSSATGATPDDVDFHVANMSGTQSAWSR